MLLGTKLYVFQFSATLGVHDSYLFGIFLHVCLLHRAQLGECIKTIVQDDYPEQWPGLLHWVKCNLQLQDQQVFAALYVLRVLSRKYE